MIIKCGRCNRVFKSIVEIEQHWKKEEILKNIKNEIQHNNRRRSSRSN